MAINIVRQREGKPRARICLMKVRCHSRDMNGILATDRTTVPNLRCAERFLCSYLLSRDTKFLKSMIIYIRYVTVQTRGRHPKAPEPHVALSLLCCTRWGFGKEIIYHCVLFECILFKFDSVSNVIRNPKIVVTFKWNVFHVLAADVRHPPARDLNFWTPG